MSLAAALICGSLVACVLVFLAVLRWDDRRHDSSRAAQEVFDAHVRDLKLATRQCGVRIGERLLHPLERMYLQWSHDTFPAPREDDCAYGCCKAGDVGIGSEVVRTSVHGRFPLDPNAPNPPGDPEYARKMAQPVPDFG